MCITEIWVCLKPPGICKNLMNGGVTSSQKVWAGRAVWVDGGTGDPPFKRKKRSPEMQKGMFLLAPRQVGEEMGLELRVNRGCWFLSPPCLDFPCTPVRWEVSKRGDRERKQVLCLLISSNSYSNSPDGFL